MSTPWGFVPLRTLAVYAILWVLLAIPIAVYYVPQFDSLRAKISGDTRPRREKIIISEEKPVARSKEPVTTNYWMVGRIVSWGEPVGRNIPVEFVFTKDPGQTKIPILIAGFENDFYGQPVYKLYTYKEFGGEYVPGEYIREEFIRRVQGSPLVQPQIVFLTSKIGNQENSIMAALESANRGNWQDLPKEPVMVEAIGILETQ